MTYATFIRKNALRNKRRTSRTVLSIGLAFAVFLGLTGGLLPAISAARKPISEAMAKH